MEVFNGFGSSVEKKNKLYALQKLICYLLYRELFLHSLKLYVKTCHLSSTFKILENAGLIILQSSG